MGKMGASSWLSVVKKALSPSKGSEQEAEDHKKNLGGSVQKRGKKKWIFRKPLPYERTIEHKEERNIASSLNSMTTTTKSNERGKLRLKLPRLEEVSVPEQKEAMKVGMATTDAAKLAVATTQDTVELIKLITPSIIVAENYAAVSIQAAFRGYLAKRARKALKGVVQLQAFIRAYNVRKRAKMTLQCMQSLQWVQNQVCDQRRRLSLSPIKPFYQLADIKANIWRRENHQIYLKKERRRHSPSSPAHTTGQNLLVNSLSSPHRSRTRAMEEQSPASPPPRYMAETESAAARVRSQSAPRQRLLLETERDRGFSSAKKRLSFAVPN